MTRDNRRLGVHTSIAGGVHLSMERAMELGCNTAQIFSHNPRGWAVSDIPSDPAALFRELRAIYDINPAFVHTSYLINLAAVSGEVLYKSIRLLIKEMDLADQLGAEYVVLHTGSASQDAGDAARKRAVGALKQVSAQKEWQAKLLLENTAGERGDISSSMRDLAEIISGADSAMIAGVVLDTCHAFQAGYDLTSDEGVEALVKEISGTVGAGSLKLIHLNDSKRTFHSRVDRHEHIGKGAIGRAGIRRVLQHPAFRDVPHVLETPKDTEEDDARNLRLVRRLMGK